MNWELVPWVGLVLMFAAVVQSAVGFAFALFAVPMMVALGVPLPQSVVMGSMCSMAMSATAAWHLRDHVPWRQIAPMACLTALTVPLGIWLQTLLVETSPARVKQVLGLILLGILLMQIAFRVKPREHVHWIWCVLAMFSCGTMGGLCGMGGPPVVLWVYAHNWSNERSRGTLLGTFAILGPSTMSMLAIQWREAVYPAFGFGLMLVPLSLVGVFFGLRIGRRISKLLLRRITMGLLAVIAVLALISPYVTG